ncbi:MAG: Maf family protein [Phycisphaerales bacterium]|nr:Maf family protein [Phycisphaerales bacterium]
MTWQEPIILASGSPRRRQLLESSGWQVSVHPPHVDDGQLDSRDVPARAWVAAMAWFKARSVLQEIATRSSGTILSADTVCELDEEVIGQPPDADAARTMIRKFRNRSHRVLTGVCLLTTDGVRREIFADTAEVTMGALSDEAIETYLATDGWRGKAGGYNLFDRVADGWPLEWIGDESTVVGLPMRRLQKIFPAHEPLDGHA